MVRRRRAERGYSLMEITVVLAVFGIFLYIVVSLTAEMRRQESRYPVNFLTNPEVNSVLARLRRDVYDTKLYYPEYAGVPAGTDVLWVDAISEAGTSEVVMWDFRTEGEVHRRVYNSAQVQVSEWVTRATPHFEVDQPPLQTPTPDGWPHGVNPVEVKALDITDPKNPKLSIDEIITPRPHT
jgi:prepilin-type N-terminal cleavage/methylation domain-containing protein